MGDQPLDTLSVPALREFTMLYDRVCRYEVVLFPDRCNNEYSIIPYFISFAGNNPNWKVA